MRRRRWCRALFLILATAALLAPGTAAADTIDAVGRFSHAGFRDRAHCTATLVAPGRAVTAAHCLPGTPAAAKAFVLPGLTPEGWPEALQATSWSVDHHARDVASLCLASRGKAAPIATSKTGPQAGETLTIVGYGQPRQYAQSRLQCAVIAVAGGGAFTLGCAVAPGTSGAPVLRPTTDGFEIVGIVSRSSADRTLALDVSGPNGLPACE